MNEIVNKFSLAGNKFMPKMYLSETGFTFRACRSFTKTRKESKNFKNRKFAIYLLKRTR